MSKSIPGPAVDELRAMKESGMSDRQIAERYGVAQSTVRSWRKRADVPGLRGKRIDYQARYRKHIDQVRELRAEGWSYARIGDRFGIHESTIISWLKQRRYRKDTIIEDTLQIVYDAIVLYKCQHNGNNPTYAHIADLVGVSTSSAIRYVRGLAEAGRIILSGTSRYVCIDVPGSRWMPPTGWKMPATLRKRKRIYKPRRSKRKQLAKEGRLCDCGHEAGWYFNAPVGGLMERKAKPRMERIVLCDDCKQLEEENGTTIHRLEMS